MKNSTYNRGYIVPVAIAIIVALIAGGTYVALKSRGGCTTEGQASPWPWDCALHTGPEKAGGTSALSIEQIKNVSMTDPMFANQSIQLVDGHYNATSPTKVGKEELGLDTTNTSYAYGDLNGDGKSDVAIILDGNSGGSGVFSYLAVFLNDKGQPKFAANKMIGDRIKINKVTVSGGIISIDMITQGPGEPLCCGTLQKTSSYKLVGNDLVSADQMSTGDNIMPHIDSISPSSGPIGTNIEIKGTGLGGFEGDLDAVFVNQNGESALINGTGPVPRTGGTIRITLPDKVCRVNNSYSGNPCTSYLNITPGTYTVYAAPWGKKSNEVKFTVTGVSSTQTDWHTYTNSKYNFTLQFPADWKVWEVGSGKLISSNDETNLSLVALAPSTSINSPHIEIQSRNASEMNGSAFSGSKSVDDFLSRNPQLLAGNPILKTSELDGEKLVWLQNNSLYAYHKGSVYTLNVYSLDQQTLEKILSTFKFTN